MTDFEWPLVSVLFITYKRFDLLRKAVESFRRNTDYPKLELVIADDGSGPEIQAQIRTLSADVFALAQKNRGLGANNNNGLRHCRGKYILMIQDDCVCHGPSDYLLNTIKVMEANPQVGIINFAGAPHPPDRSQPLLGSNEPCYMTPIPLKGDKVEYLYTDQPHVRSRAALEHVGYYTERRVLGGLENEFHYSVRWQDQDRFATAVFPAYHRKLFVHIGADRSFRANLFRCRLDRFLMPLAMLLKRHCGPVFTLGKAFVRTSVTAMEKLRIVR
jgi:glycosyltransferase involved in cell wall biosynthesis